MMMRNGVHILLVTAVGLSLAGCAKLKREKGVLFDGKAFRTKVAQVDEDRADFVVTVFKASQSIEGAREAARWSATRYCIQQYGDSGKEWVGAGPDSEGAQLTLRDDQLQFRGRCTGW
ncbi:hypothetical protein [Rhodalgimonas zhirmunskyi]|uniref:Lipoprotein n=1 Tax=Rhodalgimonas zhirmunskyi TaxID=2964767 RepID=A0AAJ1X6M8_9RHOB|nr:hypothetical protein [Rhodoalgimonas zhirmunskyi]MDQ2095374.1 hypothetical protein [Rhodoalgimonas zhirmunskyi]